MHESKGWEGIKEGKKNPTEILRKFRLNGKVIKTKELKL